MTCRGASWLVYLVCFLILVACDQKTPITDPPARLVEATAEAPQTDWEQVVQVADSSLADSLYQWQEKKLLEAGDTQQIISWRYQAALAYLQQGWSGRAETALQAALHLADSANTLRLPLHRNLGNLYYERRTYEQALYHYLEALRRVPEHGAAEDQALILQSMAGVYLDIGNRQEAGRYFAQAASLWQPLAASVKKAVSQMNYARYFMQANQTRAALDLLDAAESYFLQEGMPARLAKVYNLKGNAHYAAAEYQAALQYYRRYAREAVELSDEPLLLAEAYNNIGACLFFIKDYRAALTAYKQAWERASALQDVKISMHAAFNQAEVLEVTGDRSAALDWYKTYYALREQLYSRESNRQMAEMQQRFETEKKDQQIALLASDNALQQVLVVQKTRERNWTIAVLLGVLAATLGIGYWYRQRQQSLRLLARQEASLQQQRIKSLLQDQEIHTMEALLKGRDQERNRIAADLHDRVGSLLATARLHLSAVGEEPMQHLPKATHLLDEACTEVRQLSHQMAGGLLEAFGLQAAFEQLLQAISETGALKVECHYELSAQALSTDGEIALYRVLQELLSNVIRHAGASYVSVQLQELGEKVQLMVEDNGQGMPEVAEGEGLGWRNIRERLAPFHAQIAIDSHTQSGTSIIITLPVQHRLSPKGASNEKP